MNISVKNILLLLLASVALASCIRDDLEDCPPLRVEIGVKDKNYFNVDQTVPEERLADAKEIADRIGVENRTVMTKSFSPAEAIIEQAEKNGCDLIVMASHGRKGIAAVLLGSETQKVLTHSHFPVMVYR